MSANAPLKSIYELLPLETGGPEAREGFAFQDQVAAGFCLDMLENATLIEVWCESLDDITLIWGQPEGLCIEFVQVKGSEMNQLWSVAKLCERETKANGMGECMMEKSLAQDRCKERCRFRIVTARPVMAEIEILTLPYDAPARKHGGDKFASLHELMKPKVGTFRSQKQNDYIFWTEHVYWDVRHADQSVRDANLLRLGRILNAKGQNLAPDQIDELYTKLLKKVWDASRANPNVNLDCKRIKQVDFSPWLMGASNDFGLPTAGATAKLQEKMKRAQLAPDVFESAVELIRHYRGELLSPKYLDLNKQRLIQGEVSAKLQSLKSRLDNGQIADDGGQFHDLCLDELEKLRRQLPMEPKPPLAFLQGCMYNIAGRCLHRFRRVTA